MDVRSGRGAILLIENGPRLEKGRIIRRQSEEIRIPSAHKEKDALASIVMRIPSTVHFANAKIEEEYLKLKNGDDASRARYQWIYAAFATLEQNAHAGTHIQRRLIPIAYRNRGVDNLWKYNLPDGWRLLYTIKSGEVIIVTIVLEWLDHKDYERRFKY